MAEALRYFALNDPDLGEPRSLVRFRGQEGEIWQPETHEWIEARWLAPLLHGAFEHIVEIGGDEVQSIMKQGTLMQLRPSALEYLRKQPRPKPPVNDSVYRAGSDEGADLNERHRAVQSWWVASELVRRHPELLILETHPHGGLWDSLTVARHSMQCQTVVWLHRHGTLRVSDLDQPIMDWAIERSLSDRHQAVREIEKAAGLKAPSKTPASSPKVLTYRVITRVLTSLVNEHQAWDARSGFWDSTAWIPKRRDLTAFPSAVRAGKDNRPDDPYGESYYRFWILEHADEQVVVLDTDGKIHLKSGPVRDLTRAYAASGRRLTATIGSVLGDLLP